MLRKYLPLGLKIARPYMNVLRAAKKHNKKGKRTYEEYFFYQQKMIRKAFDRGLKIDFRITGEENLPHDTNYLLVSNHQSNLDPVIFLATSKKPLAFITKKENYDFALLKPILEASVCVPMDRNNLRSEVKTMMETEKIMKEKKLSFCIYPEGTRSREDEHPVHEFKPGALKPAYRCQVPIVPVAVYGTFRALDKKFIMKGYPIQMHILKPIDPSEYASTPTTVMAKRLEEEIRAEVGREKEEDRKLMEAKKKDIRTRKLPIYFKGI